MSRFTTSIALPRAETRLKIVTWLTGYLRRNPALLPVRRTGPVDCETHIAAIRPVNATRPPTEAPEFFRALGRHWR
ncbi:hypothetical protein IFM12275_23960 [Nocardia sputorum]|nr:hypothetical protein IFM12275_23960 [Nocardia sputorum]